jgi:hypothetical protein
MKTFCLAIAIVIGLSGCAAAVRREPEVKTVTVSVPVPVSCVTQNVDRPVLFSDQQMKAMPEDKFVLALWVDRLLRIDYETKLEAVMQACKGAQ